MTIYIDTDTPPPSGPPSPTGALMTSSIVPGIVESISRDAVDTSEPGVAEQRDRNGRVVQLGLVYSTRIRLKRRTIRAGGRDQPIGPGLAVQAEIKTGDRRIVQYLLSPISQAFDEAGRER